MRALWNRLVGSISALFSQEPAVVLGALSGIALEVATVTDSLSTEVADVPSWAAAIPIAVAALIRRYVYSPATVARNEAVAEMFTVPDDLSSLDE